MITGSSAERARPGWLKLLMNITLRRWTSEEHHIVDDRPFGGGEGMVLKPEPIFAAVGKVGYGVMPAGPKQQVSALFGDGEGISAYSRKKGPAWYYLQWASNKSNQTRMLQAAAGAPCAIRRTPLRSNRAISRRRRSGSIAC